MNEPSFEKPLPEPSPTTAPFWEGLKAHRLVLQRCAKCHRLRHYPRPMCDACHSTQCEWVEASGKGKVHSWTVAHHPFHPGFKRDLPYVVLTVELAEGVRMVAPMTENDASRLSLDLPVVLGFDDVSEDVTLPRFSIDV